MGMEIVLGDIGKLTMALQGVFNQFEMLKRELRVYTGMRENSSFISSDFII